MIRPPMPRPLAELAPPAQPAPRIRARIRAALADTLTRHGAHPRPARKDSTMPIDARTPATIAEDDAALAFLEGQGESSAVDRDALFRLDRLGLAVPMGSGSARFVTDAGRQYLALLRVTGDGPRGIVTTTHTATGYTLHYWPDGFGRRRILAARFRSATRLLDYAPAFNPPGTSGRSEADGIVGAHAQVWRRAAELEADAASRYVAPFTA